MHSDPVVAPPQIAPDPNLVAERQQAQSTLIANLQTQAQMDTANIMARYGTKMALASSGMAAPAAAPAVPVSPFGIKAA